VQIPLLWSTNSTETSPSCVYHGVISTLDTFSFCCAAVRAADVIVVVAGTDGALPAVVAGLVEAPVIAVPTSVGYGAALQVLA